MSEWIPLLQSLVWPVFIAVFLFLTRGHIIAILRSVSTRIEQGDPFEAGPSGISFGKSEQKLTRLGETAEGRSEAGQPAMRGGSPESVGESGKGVPAHYQEITYLVHSVSAPRVDTDGVERRGMSIIIDADSEDILDKIERVVYHLHPTFPNPDRETTDRKRRFILNVTAWGEFNLSAEVYFKGYQRPLILFRYLNFQS